MTQELANSIKALGLSDKEAAVYLACLEYDGALNTKIAKKTGLNRITNYEILKRLEKRGVVASYKKKGVKYFTATDPRIVIKHTKEKLQELEGLMPQLLSIAHASSGKPRIFFFEGIDGIKRIYDDSLTAKTEILVFINPSDIRKTLGDKYIDTYVQERVKKKIFIRGLAPNDEGGRKEQEIQKTKLREFRLFPREQFTVQNEIMLYDDKISIYSGKDEVGLIIENKTLAKTFRSIWEMAWKYFEVQK